MIIFESDFEFGHHDSASIDLLRRYNSIGPRLSINFSPVEIPSILGGDVPRSQLSTAIDNSVKMILTSDNAKLQELSGEIHRRRINKLGDQTDRNFSNEIALGEYVGLQYELFSSLLALEINDFCVEDREDLVKTKLIPDLGGSKQAREISLDFLSHSFNLSGLKDLPETVLIDIIDRVTQTYNDPQASLQCKTNALEFISLLPQFDELPINKTLCPAVYDTFLEKPSKLDERTTAMVQYEKSLIEALSALILKSVTSGQKSITDVLDDVQQLVSTGRGDELERHTRNSNFLNRLTTDLLGLERVTRSKISVDSFRLLDKLRTELIRLENGSLSNRLSSDTLIYLMRSDSIAVTDEQKIAFAKIYIDKVTQHSNIPTVGNDIPIICPDSYLLKEFTRILSGINLLPLNVQKVLTAFFRRITSQKPGIERLIPLQTNQEIIGKLQRFIDALPDLEKLLQKE